MIKLYTTQNIKNKILSEIDKLPEADKTHLLTNFNRLLYIPSKCLDFLFYDKTNKNNDFKSLNANILRTILTKKTYTLAIKYLKEWNIIDCNESYSAGLNNKYYSKGYRINKDYIDEPTITIKLNKEDDLYKRIINNKVKYTKYKLLKREEKQYSKYFLELELDVKVFEFIYKNLGENNYFINNNIPTSLCWSSPNQSYIYQLIREIENHENFNKSINSWLMIIKDFLDGYIRLFRCQKTGRVFNNLTSMPREMRQFLLYKGEKLYELDCSNSQPLLLNIKLNKFYKHMSYMDDLILWNRLTSTGKLYEYLMKEYNISIEDRDNFKELFFENIFYTSKKGWLITKKNKYATKFKELFPSIYDYIIIVLDNHKNSKLPILLQQLESTIWIDDISRVLYNEDIFNMSIHDSVLCLRKNVEYIKDKIYYSFRNHNIVPTIKIK